MYKKLLSNLAFNPSLIGQVSFYAKRLHKETAVRRAGLVLVVMAMILQMFAVISPPQSSLQASPNTDLINGGFSSKDEATRHCRNNTQDYKTILNYFGISCDAISNAEVTSIAPRDYDGRLHSMGRQAFGVEGEQPLRIPGAGTFFTRHFWTLNHDSSYKALKVKDRVGRTHFILFGCGNLVFIGPPHPAPPADECDNIPGVQTEKEDCDVCPRKPGIQTNEKDCDVCPRKTGIQTHDNCDVCPNKPGEQIRENCDVCPNKPGEQLTSRDCDVCPDRKGIQEKKDQCDVCPDKPGTQNSENECKPCEESQTNEDLTACLNYSKKARNITQNIPDANDTVASPGDVIEYTLTTTNTGKITIKGYQVNESLGDVLDYADVVDLHGGTRGQYDIVTWPKQDIKPGKSLTNQITVKIKSTLPNTPISSTDPNHFDMILTNVYGNTVNIKLPPSLTKEIEIATTTLPNTGPGTSLAIGFSLITVVAYFFFRSRLLAKELDIVRADFGAAGGV